MEGALPHCRLESSSSCPMEWSLNASPNTPRENLKEFSLGQGPPLGPLKSGHLVLFTLVPSELEQGLVYSRSQMMFVAGKKGERKEKEGEGRRKKERKEREREGKRGKE